MKKFLCFMLVCLASAGLAVQSFAAETPYIQFIQAEDCPCDNDNFAMEVEEMEGTIGGKALSCIINAGDAFGDGFSFDFTVPDTGDYTVWARVLYPGQSNNSLHYRFDEDEPQIWDFADEDDSETACYNSWHYFYLTKRDNEGDYEDENKYGVFTLENLEWRHAPNTLHLTKGNHTVHLTGRESGWYIDEFIVTKLSVEEYDPNYYEGNDYILEECKFCGPEWKHYYKDIYAATGETAEHYFYNTLYKAEEPVVEEPVAEAPVVEEAPAPVEETVIAPAAEAAPAPAPAPVAAPQTFDAGIIAAFTAAVSLAGYAVSKKR